MARSIVFLGTDTYYYTPKTSGNAAIWQPRQVHFERTQPFGHVLSQAHRALSKNAQAADDAVISSDYRGLTEQVALGATNSAAGLSHILMDDNHSPTSLLFDGPVGDGGEHKYGIVCLGLLAMLKWSLDGEKNILVTGHSRGGVESLVATHYLSKILHALEAEQTRVWSAEHTESTEAFDIKRLLEHTLLSTSGLTEDDKADIRRALSHEATLLSHLNDKFQTILDSRQDDNDARQHCIDVKMTKVHLTVLDPVAGDGLKFPAEFMTRAVTKLTGLSSWLPGEAFEIADIVRQGTLLVVTDERSKKFRGILPASNELFSIQPVPGNHLTPIGSYCYFSDNPLGFLSGQQQSRTGANAFQLNAVYACHKLSWYTVIDQATELGLSFNFSNCWKLSDLVGRGSKKTEGLEVAPLAAIERGYTEALSAYHGGNRRTRDEMRLLAYEQISPQVDALTTAYEYETAIPGYREENEHFRVVHNGVAPAQQKQLLQSRQEMRSRRTGGGSVVINDEHDRLRREYPQRFEAQPSPSQQDLLVIRGLQSIGLAKHVPHSLQDRVLESAVQLFISKGVVNTVTTMFSSRPGTLATEQHAAPGSAQAASSGSSDSTEQAQGDLRRRCPK